ncbi:flagellar motor switch protein FliG [Tropicimonas isoalkanivorans]|uniref:Flagellar motor switch protein FliG n=1 Tax=Tropicimonas isoalkanivorans TaxID=441112 RepID=A0A1I1DD23_9RHOB|nr:FliG C-terminal domain-containing protein [Tropicimonas isoalkanivorans]SFB70700.1 flagellar motor switch protein FliG [Tropicimonas isoalkanivorans]
MDSLAPIPIADLNAMGGSVPAPVAIGQQDRPSRMALSRRQKAAVIVRLLLSEGEKVPLDALPEEAQAELTEQFGELRLIDRDTVGAVVREFVEEMEAVGLTFPGGIEGALGMLDGHISPSTAARLRREAGVAARGDPWERISSLAPERLLRVLEEESAEVGAVMLSKLRVAQAAELLGQIPGPRARVLSYAISRTSGIQPETVRRIGLSLAAQFDSEPTGAFDDGPVQRVGAILNYSRAATRDDVLEGLDETDAEFAAEVRRAIFTFAHIPSRVTPRDVPRIVRAIDQPVLVAALSFAAGDKMMEAARDFLLENMSKRLADAVKEEMQDAGPVKAEAGEDAMNVVVSEIRQMVESGELLLVAEEG